MRTAKTDQHTFTLLGENEQFGIRLVSEKLQEGLHAIRIQLESSDGVAQVPPVLTLSWSHPAIDIAASWHPALERTKSFKADWMKPLRSNAAASAPVYSLFNANGSNRLTFAFSDALNTVYYSGGIREETAEFQCQIQLFTETTAPFGRYEGTLLVDTRELPYYESLEQVQQWWSSMPEYIPAPVPEVAKSPIYSTWYSMHQNVTAEEVERQCRIAQTLGMDAVIVDDGWQTQDNQRGYAYTGDWEAYEGKFANLAEHVKAVHDLGMKFLLWYSVPFVGKHSRAWDTFKDKILRYSENMGAAVLDPRYPEVREYIINKYENAVRDWNLDGFKLDFVDQFYSPERQLPSTAEGKDYESVPEAVDRLLTDSISRLCKLNPDIMVEFRQPYIGPAMRKYGNMFRASDCPNDAIQNRVRTLDLRLICGNTATHADMIMWNEKEPVESAALQLINLLFSVPQISVDLYKLPEDHRQMLKHWLTFWRENREVLLDGKLEPMQPELLYPLVRSTKDESEIIVTFYDELIRLGSCKRVTVVNGRLKEGLYVSIEDGGHGISAEVVLKNCRGDVTERLTLKLESGIHKLPVPPSGIAEFTIGRN